MMKIGWEQQDFGGDIKKKIILFLLGLDTMTLHQ